MPSPERERGMGKGERCGRTGSELAEQPDEQAHDTQSKFELRLDGAMHYEAQVSGDLELAVKLGRGAQGDPETSDALNRRAEGVSFQDVGRNRYGRAADLVGEPEMTTQRLFESESVRRARELVRANPRLQRRQLFHAATLSSTGSDAVTGITRTVAEKCVSPFPFPHSPFPGV